MNEKELEKRFIEFLTKEKGYSRESLLFNAPLVEHVGSQGVFKTYMADLLLLDTDSNNYLALIEFKNDIKSKSLELLDRLNRYLIVIGKPNLLVFVVTPSDKKDDVFSIHVISNNEWKLIENIDFPNYDTLRSKNQADEKKSLNDFIVEKEKLNKKRKDSFKSIAWSSLSSLLVGLIVTVFLSKEVFFKDIKIEPNTLDSIAIYSQRINHRITELEKDFVSIKSKDTVQFSHRIEPKKFFDLENRVSIIESTITQSPDKILKYQEFGFQLQSLKKDIDHVKELNDIKLTSLNDRIDQLSVWTSGLIITIIGTIIGLLVNAFRK